MTVEIRGTLGTDTAPLWPYLHIELSWHNAIALLESIDGRVNETAAELKRTLIQVMRG